MRCQRADLHARLGGHLRRAPIERTRGAFGRLVLHEVEVNPGSVTTRSLLKPASTCCSWMKLRTISAGADEQHERNRDLRDDERVARAEAAGARPCDGPRLSGSPVSSSRRRTTGIEAEQQAGDHRHHEREREHAAVDRDFRGARREARREGDEQIA